MLSRFSVAIIAALGLAELSVGQVITNDTYFYGQSPLVAPPATGDGTGDWTSAYTKAKALVSQMTTEEKANITIGLSSFDTGCSGMIQSIPRLNFTGLCLSDAGNGVRATDFVSGFASGVSVGASWNKDLAHLRAVAMAKEFYKKGVSMMLGPVVGPLGRIAEGGRNWEGFSNDPYLGGALVYESIMGAQSENVMACTKHFIGNEQETNRNPVTLTNGTVINSTSSNIDDKTLHEMYLWPFAEAVRAGTASIMCSYNRINNSYACGNSKTLNGILKEELGFQGLVVSDWYAQHGGISTVEAGLDMVMPSSTLWGDGNLVTAVNNGSLSEARLDDMAIRIIASWYKLGQDSASHPTPGVGMPVSLLEEHTLVDARDQADRPTIYQGAVEGHVLVKNNGILPLKAPKILSVFGYDAELPATYDPGTASFSGWTQGYSASNVSLALNAFEGLPQTSVFPQRADGGLIISGGGSGANTPSYISSPIAALSARAESDGTALFWDFSSESPDVVVGGPCIVFTNAFASEGLDRVGLHDPYSDDLINNVADSCNNTIVVIHNAGVQLVDAFVDHPNVSAIVFAHTPGQDAGKSIADLLYGDEQFSGRLPYTVAKNESDYGSLLSPAEPSGIYEIFPQDNFSEGVYIDYRAFDAKNITPRYEFGYGLSYTTFSYSNINISQVEGVSTATYPVGAVIEGGQEDLYDVLYQVRADVTNTGSTGGIEVPQLYVNIPGGPVKQLRGFSKVAIDQGMTTTVEFDLRRKDLSEWDVVAQKWKLQSGSYNVWVGASSRSLPLSSTITI